MKHISQDVRKFKTRLLVQALSKHEGSIELTAAELGIFAGNLERWLRELDLLSFARHLRRLRHWRIAGSCCFGSLLGCLVIPIVSLRLQSGAPTTMTSILGGIDWKLALLGGGAIWSVFWSFAPTPQPGTWYWAIFHTAQFMSMNWGRSLAVLRNERNGNGPTVNPMSGGRTIISQIPIPPVQGKDKKI